MLNRNTKIALASAAAVAALAGCAGSMAPGPSDAEARAKALETMKAGFNEKGIAKLDRLNQDETQALCTQYATGNVPKDVAAKIEQANMAAIKPPADGKYLGDWKRGEQVAQRGTGFQYSDTKETPVGGNCYACHQLTKGDFVWHDRPVAVSIRQDPRLRTRDPEVRLGQGVEHAGLFGLLVHAAFRPRGHPLRAADQGRRRAADGSGVPGQQVTDVILPEPRAGGAGPRDPIAAGDVPEPMRRATDAEPAPAHAKYVAATRQSPVRPAIRWAGPGSLFPTYPSVAR